MKRRFLFIVSLFVFVLLIGNVNAEECSKHGKPQLCNNEAGCYWSTEDSPRGKCKPIKTNQQTNEYSNYENTFVSCGITEKNKEPLIKKIPKSIPSLIHIIYLAILIAVPILLVIFGMLDLFKGLTSQKEDEIKKGQQLFVKRLIAAALIFFVLMIIKLLIGAVADSNKNGIIDCVDCFIGNDCD